MIKKVAIAMSGTIAFSLIALIGNAAAQQGEHKHLSVPTRAIAVLIPMQDHQVKGVILLEEEGDQVRVRGKVWDLEPGEHGFHIHEYGDLSKRDGTSAGGHFNPEDTDHGGPEDEAHHAGDLGNITADDEGVAMVDETFDSSKFFQLHHVIGRSIVVHAAADDLESQPSGDAGPRVAVGVIGIAQPESEKQDQDEG